METRRYADRRAYLVKAVRKRRKKVRLMAVQYKGSRCSQCGYDRCVAALEFHHLDSSRKDFGISEKGYTRSWQKIREELDKCILLCANCHRELHAQSQLSAERQIETAGEFREAYVRAAQSADTVILSGAPTEACQGTCRDYAPATLPRASELVKR